MPKGQDRARTLLDVTVDTGHRDKTEDARADPKTVPSLEAACRHLFIDVGIRASSLNSAIDSSMITIE